MGACEFRRAGLGSLIAMTTTAASTVACAAIRKAAAASSYRISIRSTPGVDVALSMPCKLNRNGAYQDVPLLLSDAERDALRQSALSIREVLASLEK